MSALESNLEIVKATFNSLECKDLKTVMSYFAEDARFFDPHYPNPRMYGKPAITAGIQWGIDSLQKFGFIINHVYGAADGSRIVMQVNTAHVLPNGRPLNFEQVFIFGFESGKITFCQAFVEYGPHGLLGVRLGLLRLYNIIRSVWRSQS